VRPPESRRPLLHTPSPSASRSEAAAGWHQLALPCHRVPHEVRLSVQIPKSAPLRLPPPAPKEHRHAATGAAPARRSPPTRNPWYTIPQPAPCPEGATEAGCHQLTSPFRRVPHAVRLLVLTNRRSQPKPITTAAYVAPSGSVLQRPGWKCGRQIVAQLSGQRH